MPRPITRVGVSCDMHCDRVDKDSTLERALVIDEKEDHNWVYSLKRNRRSAAVEVHVHVHMLTAS